MDLLKFINIRERLMNLNQIGYFMYKITLRFYLFVDNLCMLRVVLINKNKYNFILRSKLTLSS